MKKAIRYTSRIVLVALGLYFLPRTTLVFVVCGIYDVARNSRLEAGVLRRYFLGNGLATWLLSPVNTLLDLLSAPYRNPGVYRLNDLPADCRREILGLIETAGQEDLVGRLEERTRCRPRTMIFFKWFGRNVETSLDVPAFRRRFKYVKTIGVSVFRERESTAAHFGPLRVTLRVLYNLNDMPDRSAFIRVGAVENYWRDNKLFIFDDTLMHQSFNESDQPRYCLFVDILRPSLVHGLLSLVVSTVRLAMGSFNYVFYQYWVVIK